MALFDSDEFENYETLTELEKIDLAIALVQNKVSCKENKQIDFFLKDSRQKEIQLSKEYKARQAEEILKLSHKGLAHKSRERINEFYEKKERAIKRRELRERLRKSKRRKHETRNFKENSWFKIFVRWPGT